MKTKEVRISAVEAEIVHDLLLRTDKIYNYIRQKNGVELEIETAIKLQKDHDKVMIAYANFLESVALEIGKPELYTDSKFVTILKNKMLKSS
jgi:hypothetical protein